VAKGNSNNASAESSAESSSHQDQLEGDLMLEHLPPPTLWQKIALGVMVLVILGWLAFLLALAVKK
jgi:hypothetical protein